MRNGNQPISESLSQKSNFNIEFNMLDNIFVGEANHIIVCSECGERSINKQSFMELSLSLRNKEGSDQKACNPYNPFKLISSALKSV